MFKLLFDSSKTKEPTQIDQKNLGAEVMATQKALGVDLTDNMEILSQIIQGFGENNTEQILAAVEEYNNTIANTDEKKIPVDKNVVEAVKKFHNELVSYMTNGKTTLGYAKNQKDRADIINGVSDFKEARTMYGAIKNFVSKDIIAAKDSLLTEEVIANNPLIKTTVEQLFDKFSDIKSRDTFFQYKYSQMYIFLVAYVQHIYQTMQKYIEDVTFINKAADEYRKGVYRDLLNKILDTFVQGDKIEGTLPFEDLDKYLKDLHSKVEAKQKEQMRHLAETQNTTLAGVLEFLINSGSLDQQSLNNLSGAITKQRGQVPATPAQVVQQAQLRATTTPTNIFQGQRQYGGFVKGSSTFPQAFYDLS